MSEIIELLFEEVSKDNLKKYLAIVADDRQLVDFQIFAEHPKSGEILKNRKLVLKYLDEFDAGSLYLKFSNFEVAGRSIAQIRMQVFKYEGKVDLSLDIDSEYFEELNPLKNLQAWSGKLSQELDAKTYFCGYEPANDEDTRFFTESELGPLLISENPS